MKNSTILSRLAKVEERVGETEVGGPPRMYFCDGPKDMDSHEFLTGLGYNLAPNSIEVHFVSAGKDLVARDRTPEFAPENALTELGG